MASILNNDPQAPVKQIQMKTTSFYGSTGPSTLVYTPIPPSLLTQKLPQNPGL